MFSLKESLHRQGITYRVFYCDSLMGQVVSHTLKDPILRVPYLFKNEVLWHLYCSVYFSWKK